MNRRVRVLQVVITVSALLIALVHVAWPDLTVDAITLALFAIAIAPWLAPLFEYLEFPGGWKVGLRDLERTANEMNKAGLLAPASKGPKPVHAFLSVAQQDPKLALAGLRIEIEQRLLKLAESHGLGGRRMGIGGLLRLLAKEDLLTSQERTVLADMVGLLNSAVHGARVDAQATDWALEVGPRILEALDSRLGEDSPQAGAPSSDPP